MVGVLVGCEDCGTDFDGVFGGHPVVGIDSLPDCEKAIDIVMVKPEQRIEGCVITLRGLLMRASFGKE